MTPFVLPKLLTHWGLTFLIVLSLCQTGCWKDTSDVCRRWGHLSSLCNTNRVWGNRKIISFAGCKWKTEGEPVNVRLPGRRGSLPAWRFADEKLTQQLCGWKHHEETRVTGQAVWPESNPPTCEEGFTCLSPWEASESNWEENNSQTPRRPQTEGEEQCLRAGDFFRLVLQWLNSSWKPP